MEEMMKQRVMTVVLIQFFISALFITPLFAQKKKAVGDIIAEGTGLGVNTSEALMAAKRDAVEQGIGVMLISQTEVENFMVQRDVVISKTVGSVQKYDIISETKNSDGLIEIKIKARISRSTMKSNLVAFKILLESMNKPKVMVIVKEKYQDEYSATNMASENAIIAKLKNPYEFEMVDPSVVANIKASEQQMASLEGNPKAAASIGTMNGAEVIIVGTAQAVEAKNLAFDLGGMKSVQGDISLRAINCTTGRIIATGKGHAAKVHINPNTAGVNALTVASGKAVDVLIEKIITDWNNQINNGIQISVTITGVQTYRQSNAIVQTFQTMPGVVSAKNRGWSSEGAVIKLDVQYKGNVDGFCSKADGYKMKSTGGSLSITTVNGNRVGLKMLVQ